MYSFVFTNLCAQHKSLQGKLYRLFTYTVTTAGGFQLPTVKLSCIQYDSAVKKDHEGLGFSENYHLIASLDFYNVSCQCFILSFGPVCVSSSAISQVAENKGWTK